MSAGSSNLTVFGSTVLSMWYPYQSVRRIIPSAIEYRATSEQEKAASLQTIDRVLKDGKYLVMKQGFSKYRCFGSFAGGIFQQYSNTGIIGQFVSENCAFCRGKLYGDQRGRTGYALGFDGLYCTEKCHAGQCLSDECSAKASRAYSREQFAGSILYFQNISAVTYDKHGYEIRQRMDYSHAGIKKVVCLQITGPAF